MDSSLSALRRLLFDARSMESNGTADNERARRALNRAARELSDELPDAFSPSMEHAVLLPVWRQSVLTLQATTSDRVLQISPVGGGVVDTTLYDTLPDVEGRWDGIMHLEITLPDGTIQRRQSREWWRVTTGLANIYNYYVSLDRPWRNTTDTDLVFKAYQPAFFVSSDVKHLTGPIKVFDESHALVASIGLSTATAEGLAPDLKTGQARPNLFWQANSVQLPAPTVAPTAVISPGSQPAEAWVGPWQEGSFDFVYTYCWGKRDEEWQENVMGAPDPIWESAPSASVTLTQASASGAAIRIEPTPIDPDYGWYSVGNLPHGRGGFFIRIYARRKTILTAGAGTINRSNISNRYYFLGQFDPINDGTAYYVWNGSIPINFNRPLHHSTGYYAYGYHPLPDKRYVLDIPVSRPPIELIDPQDTLPIKQGKATEALIELACHHFSLLDGVDAASAERHRQAYLDKIKAVRSQENIVDFIPAAGYGYDGLPRQWWRYETQ